MKMLQNCAQTLPLWIGNPGEKPPPLCGATPPELNYIGKVCSEASIPANKPIFYRLGYSYHFSETLN